MVEVDGFPVLIMTDDGDILVLVRDGVHCAEQKHHHRQQQDVVLLPRIEHGWFLRRQRPLLLLLLLLLLRFSAALPLVTRLFPLSL